jgi:hypothetical protein
VGFGACVSSFGLYERGISRELLEKVTRRRSSMEFLRTVRTKFE